MVNKKANILFSKIFSGFHVYIIDDPQSTKCPDSLNNIIDAYDRRNRNDDGLSENAYRKGAMFDPSSEKNKLSVFFKFN